MKNIYKNIIFQCLLNDPLGIDNFDFEENEILYTVIYKPFNSVFKYSFLSAEDSFDSFWLGGTKFAPSFPAEDRTFGYVQFDESTMADFNDWINNELRAYIDDKKEIDLWGEYKKGIKQTPVKDFDYEDLSNFTILEKENIKLGLSELKYLIAERFTSTDAQIEIVNNRISYLIAAVERTNKTDYKSLFISTIFSIMIALSLDTAKGQELYALFIQVLQIVPALGK